MRIVACLNGTLRPGAHPALPLSAGQLAADAHAAAAAGASEIHLHPRDARGEQALEPQALTPTLEQVRAAVPEVPVEITTSLAAEPDSWRRYDLVGRWGQLPDAATVSLHEPGSVEVVRLLVDRRIRVRAVLCTVDAARILTRTGVDVDAVVLCPQEARLDEAQRTVQRMEQVLDRGKVTVPRMLHGTGDTAWPLLDQALEAGYDIRIGLEDTLVGPDGAQARDNAELVRAAVSRIPAPA
ncbi:3-keto-5-aminohexanoate cleavage protein [Lipingzhangella sp. LS1_29]|uniref:3-keto-5-aminohexanoate cleavage protein n=1 Tax=Lipingzhangella rawalii TaxID=2055835 RepID=A0ABU2H4G4_9ACTN|nr:3-keto-5-aminohexanoate cleavage protein [Lipingzhangella rawalii]MDS1270186.1 3-keto-5-aminohexanoate cleavage protein [Lipingzhangella rawalii]